MIRKRNILRVSLPKEVNVKPINNRNLAEYERIKKYREKYELQNSKKNGFINFGHTVNLAKLEPSSNQLEWVSKKKICIVFHIFYSDLTNEIIHRLKNLKFKFDLIIVSPKLSPFSQSKEIAKYFDFKPTYLECPNVGKDIGGKLITIEHILSTKKEYDFLIMAHDKKSTHMNKDMANSWRNDLYDGIFLDKNVNLILNGFIKNEKIKLSGTKVREGITDSRAIAVNPGNVNYINILCKQVFNISMPNDTSFVGGTMFWMDWNYFSEIFKKINIGSVIKYLEKGNVKEPSYSHAMERMFGILVTYNNYKIGYL